MATPITPPVTDTPTARTAEGVGTTATPTARTAVTPATTALPTARGAITPSTTPVPTARTSLTPATTAIPTARSAVTPSSNPTPTAVGALSPVAALRTGGDVVNLDFCQQLYNVDFTYSRGSAATYIGRQINAFNQYEYILKTDPLTGASPRIEYDAATGECLGYLAEGASTNLALRSEEFDNASWSKSNATTGSNLAIAPDGTLSGDSIIDDTSNASHRVSQDYTVSSGATVTLSCYIKSNSPLKIALFENTISQGRIFDPVLGLIDDALVAAPAGGSSIKSTGNGWYRCSITVTVPSTSVSLRIFTISGTVSTYVGDGSSVLLWGAQCEALPFATSYIRTEGSAVTRAADLLQVNEGSAISSEKVYSLNVDFDVLGLGLTNQYIYDFSGATGLSRFARASSTGTIIVSDGPSSSTAVSTPLLIPNQKRQITAAREAIQETKFYSDNILKSAVGNSFIISGFSSLLVGSWSTSLNSFHLFGHVRSLSYYNIGLTADEVKAL